MDKQKKTDSIYINREISWLSFNERVLLEAADVSVPLLERLKFLMIYQSNLEEFYRVRIGILTHRFMLEPDKRDPLSGMLPDELMEEVLRITREQQSLAESVWKAIRAELRHSGVEVLSFNKISKVDELMSKKLFGDIRNLLFPKIISLNQPFPFLWGEESYVIAFLGRGSAQQMAVIPMHRVPAYLSFEIDGCQKIVLTDQLVRRFLPLLLKKEKILESAVVKVTRNADVFLSQIADKEDLRQKTSTMLSKRKREAPVRAQIYGKLSDASRALLIKKLHVPERMVFSVNIPFDLSFRSAVGGHDNFRYDERKPAREIGLKKGEYFRYIDRNDLLMSYPFQSMLPFVDLIYEAADDPEVLSIKITLYRMSASSKVAAALAYAADRGKDVLCLLELRARFDEQNNIDYSEMLEDAGCRIIYGLPNHKVHSKLCLITRQHEGNLSYITQVGTVYRPLPDHLEPGCGQGRRGDLRGPAAGRTAPRGQDPLDCAAELQKPGDRIPGPRDRQGAGGKGPDEDQRHEQPRGHGKAHRVLEGRRAGRAVHPRHLLSAAGDSGPDREHRGQKRGRALA